ncbi:MAG: hypothetical protein ACRDO1_09160 [Nocardioidaceae bacterium]
MYRSRLAAAVALMAVAVGACAETPKAADLQEAAAKGPEMSDSDATQAVFDYIDLVNDALAGEGTSDLSAATDPGCTCNALVDMIKNGLAGGGEFVGAEFSASKVKVTSTEPGQAAVRATVSITAYEIQTPDGLLVDERPAETYVATYVLHTDGDAWVVADVKPVEDKS